MFPGSTGGTTSLRVRLTLSLLLVAMLGITGVPSFAETPATPAGGIQSGEKPPPRLPQPHRSVNGARSRSTK